MLLFMFIFDNCNIMQEMWVLIFDCQLSLYSTAQVEKFSYTVTDAVGIHARPAGLLVKEAKKYASKIVICKDGRTAEAGKPMAVMGLGVKCGQTVEVEITGEDEDAAYEAVRAFFEKNL